MATATSDETETKLLHGLRKRVPGLPCDLDLTSTITALRHGQVVAGVSTLIPGPGFRNLYNNVSDRVRALTAGFLTLVLAD